MNPEQIHLHKRKRIHEEHQKYPHPDPKIRFLDNLVYIIAFIFPLSAIPQIINIWVYKNAQGVSIVSWGLFLILTIPLIAYGIVHKSKQLSIMWILWLIVYITIIVGTYLYG